MGVLDIDITALGLDIGAYSAVLIGTFVPNKTGLAKSVIYYVCRALDISFAVGILDSQHKISAVLFCYKVFIKSGAQIADVHIAGG